jgi:membrane-bound lytic murein transglycosylase B
MQDKTREGRPRRSGRAVAALLALVLAACAGTAGNAHAAKKKPAAAKRDNAGPAYGQREDAMRLADDIAQRNGWPREWVRDQISQARYVSTVARLIMPPPVGVAKNWAAYRDRFVEPQRIAAGVQFWNDNARSLADAETRFGVPASVIVGIVGVETFYGRITGGFRVLDALATLSLDFPGGRSDRSPYFRSELEEFLRMCRREQRDCASFKGSYAGAMGLPQFMPSSINEYAVDFDGDGHVDLLDSPADVVGSVARFLAEKGWERGLPTHYEVVPPADEAQRAVLLTPDILPRFTVTEMAERGAVLDEPARRNPGLLSLVMLENGDAPPSYIAGTQNFYTVTRYNWSSYYALAVIELGSAVKAARSASAGTGLPNK